MIKVFRNRTGDRKPLNVGLLAPGDALESDLVAALRTRSGRVFVEQLLSGSGLSTLYEWVRTGRLVGAGEGPSSAAIVARAREGEESVSEAVAARHRWR